jgi:hypothetical protein
LINWTVNEFINFRVYLILAFINKKWHSGNTFSRNYRRNSRILPGKIRIYLGLINTDWSNMPKSILFSKFNLCLPYANHLFHNFIRNHSYTVFSILSNLQGHEIWRDHLKIKL